MRRWLLSILFAGLLLLFPLKASAASLPHIVDQDDLLTAAEEARLEQKAVQLSEVYQMDVVILTVYSLDGAFSESYADDYFDDNGYGLGEERSGVLFLLSTEYRDWAISTSGETILALTDYGIQSIFSDISGYLADDLYYDAFSAYLDALQTYFEAYCNGTPIDGFEGVYEGPGSLETGTQEDIYYYDGGSDSFPIIMAPIAGLVSAVVTLLILRGQMNTVKPQKDAGNYVIADSAQITKHQDIFLYSKVHKTKKQESSSSHGGSSVHTGSSGRSHGGGHGKF